MSESFPSNFVGIRGTDRDSMTSFQLTKTWVLPERKLLESYEISYVEFTSAAAPSPRPEDDSVL